MSLFTTRARSHRSDARLHSEAREEWRLRRALPVDAAELMDLFRLLGYPASVEQIGSRLERLTGDPGYGAWVIEGMESGRLLGFAAAHLCHPIEQDAPVAQLIALVTCPTARGGGVGRALVDRFEEWGRQRGATRAVVTSGESSAREIAHRSYESFGFERTGIRFGKRL